MVKYFCLYDKIRVWISHVDPLYLKSNNCETATTHADWFLILSFLFDNDYLRIYLNII